MDIGAHQGTAGNRFLFWRERFSQCNLLLNKMIHLTFMWLCKCNTPYAIAYTWHSSHIICAYFNYFRQPVTDSLDELNYCIGGEGVEWGWMSPSSKSVNTIEAMSLKVFGCKVV